MAPTSPPPQAPAPQARALVLLLAAAAALVWANSGASGTYESFWRTAVLGDELRHWVNDALMTVFFLVVGLEIKAELVHGALSDRRKAAMPAVAAVGGMAVPAVIFLLVNVGHPGARGWGIPMATDIAFAMGVVAVAGRRAPPSLRLFLLTLAVADDIGAIIVIGLFYGSGPEPVFIGAAASVVALLVVLKRAGVERTSPYLGLGAVLWLCTYASGIHATIAGVMLGLVMPAGRRRSATGSPAAPLEDVLRPWSELLVLPVFALANAGVVISVRSFDASGAGAVALGVSLGLVLGKTVGILGATWLARRLGIGDLPDGATWPMMFGVACIGGVGFTVALFVTGLAYGPGPLADAARLGTIGGSMLAAVVGGSVLWCAARRRITPVR